MYKYAIIWYSIIALTLLLWGYLIPSFPFPVFLAISPLLGLYATCRQGSRSWSEGFLAVAFVFVLLFVTIALTNKGSNDVSCSFLYGLIISSAFLLFALSDSVIPNKWGYFTLIVYFTGVEYLAMAWQPTFATYALGSTLSAFPGIQRWNDATGITGVSAWILVGNILFYRVLNMVRQPAPKARPVIWGVYALAITLLPALLSLWIDSHSTVLHPSDIVHNLEKSLVNESTGEYYELFGRTCAWLSGFLFLYALVNLRTKKK